MLDSSKLVIEYIFCELNTSFFDGGKPCFYRKQPVFTAKEKKRKRPKEPLETPATRFEPKTAQTGTSQPLQEQKACTGRN